MERIRVVNLMRNPSFLLKLSGILHFAFGLCRFGRHNSFVRLKGLTAVALTALFAVCLPKPALTQTPATAWGYISGSESAKVDDSGTVPGGRNGAATWTDQSGNFWLFGGAGLDSNNVSSNLNDLWEYSGGTWTLKSGSFTVASGACNVGNYTSGTYAVGGRSYAATWVDAAGNLWLFGGFGCATTTTPGNLNDLWMYNIASGKWTFEGGDQTTNQKGVYGALLASSNTFLPGARERSIALTTADGSFWLLGGSGIDSSGNPGLLNDLWKFNPTTLAWTWVSGSLTNGQVGSYGKLGQAGATNVPGSREAAAGTVDSAGNLWLFGGSGCNTSCTTPGTLNDLWLFDPATQEWTWEAGSQAQNIAGVSGTEFVTATANVPGTRDGSFLWIDAANNLWLFGGFGYGTDGTAGELNDLWEFDTTSLEWTWAGGTTTQAAARTPVYGTEGTPAITNIPGGRDSYAAWNTLDNNFWLFGGNGYDSTSTLGDLSDLWEAISPTPTPAFILAAGTYAGAQSLTITDALSGAIIYYTTDDTAPTTSSPQYIGPFSIDNTETVEAIAVASGRSQSLVRSAGYVIGPETTTITWQPPAPITYGTLLSSVQLDASTGVPGSFTYAPAAGTLLTAGTHTLHVTFQPDDTDQFTTPSDSVQIVVNQATPIVTWPTPANIAYGTALGATQLDATASFNGASLPGAFVYSPVAGTVLTAGSHTLTVTFTPTDTTDFTTATASVTLVVTQDTPTITWAKPAAITYGTALSATQLDATAAYNGTAIPGTFVYSPAAGAILPAGTQTLNVTFTPTDNTDYATVEGTTTLVVNQATPIITWPTPAAIAYGTALSATQLDATASFNGAIVPGTFVYSPVAGSVLTVGQHTLSVTFTPTDTTDYTTATGSTTIVVNQVTPVITWPTPASIAYGTALSAIQLDATASVPGVFAYLPVAGAVLTAGSHTLTVTFTPTDNIDYTAATASVTLVVTQDIPTITWAKPAAITYGAALGATQLDATAAYNGTAVPGTFLYSPAAGVILPVGTQNLNVTFTPADATDYGTVQASTTIVVNQASSIVNWPAPAAITYGTALSSAQLDATSPVAGAFVYSPAAGTVLTAGAHTLSVTFTPSDAADLTPATATVSITVNPATPVITWNTPVPIAYGTALSSTQLDATASNNGAPVAGTFVYSPAAGIVPSLGTTTLAVTFTPTDTTDYISPVTATVQLTVTGNDFTINASPAQEAVISGLPAAYVITVAPVDGAYANAVSLSASGLPSGFTATFSPTSVTPGSAPANSILTVSTSSSAAANRWPLLPIGGTGIVAAMLAGFGLRRARKGSRWLLITLIAFLSLASAAALTGCGGSTTSRSLANYPITVTGTAGGLTHTTEVIITVQ
jgi:N-acetylneuraminic acid mutarotase